MTADRSLAGLGGPTARRTAHEFARDALRHAILRGQLPGGRRLVQSEIAEQLQISTTPVREALRDLATEGLIRLDAHRGAVVRQLDIAEVREIYELRRLLEPEAMRRCAREISAGNLARAVELREEMDRETDVGKWTERNREFHATLMRDVRSGRLTRLITGLQDSAAPYVAAALRGQTLMAADANAEHQLFIDALRAGDGERAAEAALRHLDSTIAALEHEHEHVAQEPDGGEVATAS